MTASIGISSFPEDGDEWQTLLKHADLAMYGAKQLGKNGYQFYCRGMSASLQRRIDMESHLHRALEQNEFMLYYQPRIALASGACTTVEALIRWRHPELGVVLPGDFIPFAEQSSAIVEIGAWALREACRQNASWCAQGLSPVRVSVNLSARQFADKSLRLTIIDALRQAGLPGNLLELELTESMVMRDAEQASSWLSRLKRIGVRLAIDDFGTGYSSLRLPEPLAHRYGQDRPQLHPLHTRKPQRHADYQRGNRARAPARAGSGRRRRGERSAT
ncbi:bifunctional diguanylate cyclase/phosphodiesterase [Cupriavidus sp. amp6]|uniref:putative bifunctional diguanylate cyclase/phosphodiesterase n=1 Tax=Cupriavidus sp. amp6 TaxID=388051 RepID=UPI00041E18B4|nr:GGDEF domain-containing phosphodiesterase [Cupriavidus sp. amp6]